MSSSSTSAYFEAGRQTWPSRLYHYRKTYAAAWRWTGARKKHGSVKKLRYKKGGAE